VFKNLRRFQREYLNNFLLSFSLSLLSHLFFFFSFLLSPFGFLSSCQELCCECLGELGAIDPDRLDLGVSQSAKKMEEISSLSTREECVLFSCRLIETQLVQVLRSSKADTQDLASHATQELLNFCGFSQKTFQPQSSSDENFSMPTEDNSSTARKGNMVPSQLWETFSPQVRQIILPLTKSKYSCVSEPKKAEYPIYPTKSRFSDWIAQWITDLVSRVPKSDSKTVFFQYSLPTPWSLILIVLVHTTGVSGMLSGLQERCEHSLVHPPIFGACGHPSWKRQ